jgi:polar amino acid transport system substrate-binding protein
MRAYIGYLFSFGWGCLCFIPTYTWAETIRFATIDYCPFTCDPIKEEGKEGFMTDVLREAFAEPEYTLEIDMLPYARAVSSVESGTYDGIIVVSKDYAPDLVYPSGPTVMQRVVFLVNSGESWRYTGIKSLPQVTVGIVKGYYYVDADLIMYLEKEQNNETRVNVMHGDNTTNRGLRMLKSNRITTLLEGEYSAMYEVKKMGEMGTVTIAGYTTEAFENYSGFSPLNPKAKQYAKTLSETITQLQRSGRLDEILLRYGITNE